jgi:hypothetical protein
LPIKARIEVATCEGTPTAEAPTCEATPTVEAPACERMPSAEVASTTPMAAAFVSACGHGRLCNPDGERDGSAEIPEPVHDCFLP